MMLRLNIVTLLFSTVSAAGPLLCSGVAHRTANGFGYPIVTANSLTELESSIRKQLAARPQRPKANLTRVTSVTALMDLVKNSPERQPFTAIGTPIPDEEGGYEILHALAGRDRTALRSLGIGDLPEKWQEKDPREWAVAQANDGSLHLIVGNETSIDYRAEGLRPLMHTHPGAVQDWNSKTDFAKLIAADLKNKGPICPSAVDIWSAYTGLATPAGTIVLPAIYHLDTERPEHVAFLRPNVRLKYSNIRPIGIHKERPVLEFKVELETDAGDALWTGPLYMAVTSELYDPAPHILTKPPRGYSRLK